MKCPNCLSVMCNLTEIIQMNDDTQRMDLHCCNKECPSTSVSYTPHMGVFIRPSEPWKCYSYHLPIQYHGNWYTLESAQSIFNKVTNIYKLDQFGLLHTGQPLVKVSFIPISTGDDMHLEAIKLFNRLMGLVAFT